VDLLAAKAPRVESGEELVLNIVATVTNLSFYHHPNNVLYSNKQAILRRTFSVFQSCRFQMFVVVCSTCHSNPTTAGSVGSAYLNLNGSYHKPSLCQLPCRCTAVVVQHKPRNGDGECPCSGQLFTRCRLSRGYAQNSRYTSIIFASH
jgi:hypothetical protein